MAVKINFPNSPPGDVVSGLPVDASLASNLPTLVAGAMHRISVAGTFENSSLIEPQNFSFEEGDYIKGNRAGDKWNPVAGNADIDDEAFGSSWDGDLLNAPSRNAIYDKAVAQDSAHTTHVSNTNNPHSVTTTQLGLENVDNTSDADKPISTATQSALDGKADDALFTGATDSVDGSSGLVIQPLAGDEGRYLKGDGTWGDPSSGSAVPFTGDSGSGGSQGLVPAPATGDATKFLKGDGTWDDVAVVGETETPDGAKAKAIKYAIALG
jgi:hypothetical protein